MLSASVAAPVAARAPRRKPSPPAADWPLLVASLGGTETTIPAVAAMAGIARLGRADATRIGTALHAHGWRVAERRGDGGRERVYRRS